MNKIKKQSGFSLIETIVAIAILAMSVGALLNLTAGGYFSIRYSKNDIVANNLLQESLEYIRNSRDTDIQQGTTTWDLWLAKFNVDQGGSQVGGALTRGCFSGNGCTVDSYVSSINIKECSSTCTPLLFYPTEQFYGYSVSYPHVAVGSSSYATSYVRTIKMVVSSRDPQQIIVTATITWYNGNSNRSISQSMVIANWKT